MADINLTAAQVATIILSVGNVNNLNTSDKSSIVAACNEILKISETGGSGLPSWSNTDVGKFLRIGASGNPAWQALTNVAEEGA